MKVIFKHPGKSAYHDDSIWMKLNRGNEGWWLLPGHHLVVLTDEEIKQLTESKKRKDQ